MFKYKETHFLKYERDIHGVIYNRDDNFISCRSQGKIWRYNDEILVFESPRKIRIKGNSKDEEGNIIREWDYSDLILSVETTTEEIIIKFKEENLEKLEELFKVRKRRTVEMNEGQKQILRDRLAKARMEKLNGNSDIE